MSGKVGAIIHDGWSYDYFNYLGLFSSYELGKGNNVSEVEMNCFINFTLAFFFQMIVTMMMRQISW